MTDREEAFSPAYSSLESLRSLADIWNDSPPMRHFGARLEFERLDRVLAVVDPVRDFHRGGLGTDAVNGVALAGLFDLVIGTVGWLTRPDARTATVNLAMSFLRPTRGERIVGEGWLVRRGLNILFASAEIRDGSGEITARCDGTCAVAMGRTESEFTARMRGETPPG
jgi:acyl-coenzyme A thioesterase PaaI-like protein